ncbi:MAG TPA: hypothetical protein VD902_06530 [Symbiobacteriaceae bacterium]|nr:hypothetical protein [Symbiobacteriaceae bacterium]
MAAAAAGAGSHREVTEEQALRTDRLLFDFCLAHGRGAYEAEGPAPARLPRGAAAAMTVAARRLYRALERNAGAWAVPPFPLREQVLAAGVRHTPPFWARFDGFLREGGGVFFAELNLDRPGGHREAMAAPHAGAAFRRRFVRALRLHWDRHGSGAAPRAAFLVDPAHREELHIAHFYAGLLEAELGWPCTVAGPLNLGVDGGRALAFGEPVTLLMRQFPTEFFHEVPAMDSLLRLHHAGKLLILNDPTAVRGQAKSCFAWLWEQVLAGGGALSRAEVAAVVDTVPYTAGMEAGVLPADAAVPEGESAPAPLVLLSQPEHWVLKPVLGRYSQGVTCGAVAPAEQWGAAVAAALAEPGYWIAQRFIPQARVSLTRWTAGAREQVEGYVNWGLHFLGGRPAGWMARCSRTPVTDDAWFAPVSLAPAEEEEHGAIHSAPDGG